MALCVLEDVMLAKSRHRVEGDGVTARLSVLTCENDAGDTEYVYWVELHDSEGNTVMKEASPDFMIASDIYERLKATLGPAVA